MSVIVDTDSTESVSQSASTLRYRFSAMRVSFSWFGVRRSLTADQCRQAAEQFGAERAFISAGKKLVDTSHPAFRALNHLRREIGEQWKNSSLPFPEPGIRLIRHEDINPLGHRMTAYKRQLTEAVQDLEDQLEELKLLAQQRLGALYSEADYPPSFVGLFDVNWDFPNVEPPEYLRRLQPDVYEQECHRVRSRFDEAVLLAEQAFVDELSGLVSHLGERLDGSEDGKPKIFRDSAIENLKDFFDRFQRLNIHSSEQLDGLVQQAQTLLSGVRPQQLRDSSSLRQQVATQLSGVQSVLDGMMVDRPRRRILRS